MHVRHPIAYVLTITAVISLLGCTAAKRRANAVSCGNYMCSIGCAARIWAGDHDGYWPSDLLSMSNELSTTKILICPGDDSRKPGPWATFNPTQSSYEIVTPHLRDGDTNGVFLRCKIHGYLGYADGSVFDGVSRRAKKLP